MKERPRHRGCGEHTAPFADAVTSPQHNEKINCKAELEEGGNDNVTCRIPSRDVECLEEPNERIRGKRENDPHHQKNERPEMRCNYEMLDQVLPFRVKQRIEQQCKNWDEQKNQGF